MTSAMTSSLGRTLLAFAVLNSVLQGQICLLIQVYALTSNAKEAEAEQFYEDLQDLLELIPKKDVLFIIGDWNANIMSRNTWSNRKIWPWSTE